VANTQISRYYKQLDTLFQEIAKRICRAGNSDPLAKEFRKRCKELGVPDEAIGALGKVEANRVAGQGSATLRQMALDKMLGMLGRLPEEGQDNVIADWVASYVGQRGSDRYYPSRKKDMMGTEQMVEATLQVSAMKNGIPPIVTSEQDPAVFAQTFLTAAVSALEAVQQGANPIESLAFVDIAIPAAIAHIQRLSQDPSRAPMAKQLMEAIKQTAGTVDKLRQFVSDMQQKQQEEAAQAQAQGGDGQQQLPPDVMEKLNIERAKGMNKIELMRMSHEQRSKQRDEQHQSEMARRMQDAQLSVAEKDLLTAAEIKRQRIKSENQPAVK
jgi:hypothetical protein